MMTAIEVEQLQQRVYAQISEWEEAITRLDQKRAILREAVKIRIKLGATFDEDDVVERLEQMLFPEEIQFVEEHVPVSMREKEEAASPDLITAQTTANKITAEIAAAKMRIPDWAGVRWVNTRGA